MNSIDKIELTYLQIEDHENIVALMSDEYKDLEDSSWTFDEYSALLAKFPKGQVGIKIDGELAAFALSIVVDYNKFDDSHTYKEITGKYSFNTHDDKGDTLYGVDVFVSKKYRGLRLGRRLYEFRQELCEELNLKGIIFGGRLPNYKKYSETLTPKEYIS
ncbi:MAG: GNAT family N-acetyltransferase, partial [Aliarcobacter sp.]|nr:GNAT family N-acetyltransferase [Aliarcobacter sp.]